jgi:hypothetical protein
VTYRCATERRCLLLDLVLTPQQLIVHKPRYRRSPSLNEQTSTDAGRARNTLDGDRRWKGWTLDIRDADSFSLDCNHLKEVILTKAAVEADLEARHAGIRVRSDGTRYAG